MFENEINCELPSVLKYSVLVNSLFELTAIKENFFKEILGLIYYNKRNPQPHIANPEAFVIDSLSQGRYRFVLRSVPASQNYPYLQQQG